MRARSLTASSGTTRRRTPWRSPLGKTRLVVAANRPPVTRGPRGRFRRTAGAGGLIAALTPAMDTAGGTWIAAGPAQGPRRWSDPKTAFDVRFVPLTPTEQAGYYLGYANRVLWPLCHLRLGRIEFHRADWEEYRRVNARFARALAGHARDDGSVVWIHDYHLALVPRLLRKQAPRVRSSLFWQIPWPPYFVFRANPTRRAILRGLLGADVLAFQTKAYARNFRECCKEEFGPRLLSRGAVVRLEGHTTRIEAFGVGIDVAAIAASARGDDVRRQARRLRRSLAPRPGMRIGLGVDRMDYSKGILRRFEAIEQLFERHPEHVGRFVFVEVAGPTRSDIPAYLEYRRRVLEGAERVNRRWARPGWRPVHLVTTGLSTPELHAHYRAADVLLVTSTADGMNLVAKEFVAAQVDHRGLPVVSETVGASEELPEAIQVNPFDAEGVAAAVHRALSMKPSSRRRRLVALRGRLRRNTTYDWLSRNLSALRAASTAHRAAPRRRTRRAGW